VAQRTFSIAAVNVIDRYDATHVDGGLALCRCNATKQASGKWQVAGGRWQVTAISLQVHLHNQSHFKVESVPKKQSLPWRPPRHAVLQARDFIVVSGFAESSGFKPLVFDPDDS
jgi:hypothetical protein